MRSTEKLVTAEPIAMELLAGVPRAGVVSVERLLDSMPSLAIDSHADFRAAARIYRDVRAVGHTIRSMVDCLVAAVALRQGDVVVIHDDADFDRIAAVTGLRVERWPS
jgi:predicted nucleic acid-binding protein